MAVRFSGLVYLSAGESFVAILILLTSGAVAQVAAPKPAATQPAKTVGIPADQLIAEALARIKEHP